MPFCKALIEALVYAPSISPQGRQMTSISPLYRRYRTIEAKAVWHIRDEKQNPRLDGVGFKCHIAL